MSFIRTIEPGEAEGALKTIYDEVKKQMGVVPNIMRVQSLRPDLLEATSLLYQRMMLEPHGLSRVTKELLAAYVSKINVCEY